MSRSRRDPPSALASSQRTQPPPALHNHVDVYYEILEPLSNAASSLGTSYGTLKPATKRAHDHGPSGLWVSTQHLTQDSDHNGRVRVSNDIWAISERRFVSATTRTGVETGRPTPRISIYESTPFPPTSLQYLAGTFVQPAQRIVATDLIGILQTAQQSPDIIKYVTIGSFHPASSFVLADPDLPDCPLVYCSPGFVKLTGYPDLECVGRNCRFLQCPSGEMTSGSRRRTFADGAVIHHMKAQVSAFQPCQVSIVNYRRGGQPFVNFVTMFPLEVSGKRYVLCFSIDLVEHPEALLSKTGDGGMVVSYY